MPWQNSSHGLHYVETEDDLLSQKIHEMIEEVQVRSGLIAGLHFQRRDRHYYRGVVLVHNLTGTSERLRILAKRLAVYGFSVLAIDLPEHGMNDNRYSMGLASETILEAVEYLKTQFGVQKIAVIGHSLGAHAALFASFGYSRAIEIQLWELSKSLSNLLEEKWKVIGRLKRQERHLLNNPEGLLKFERLVDAEIKHIHEGLDTHYADLKNLIYGALQNVYKQHASIACFVFLSMPKTLFKNPPGLGTLALIGHRPFKFMVERLSRSEFDDDQQFQHHAKWGSIHTDDLRQFVLYFVHMHTPEDYLKVIEHIAEFRRGDPLYKIFRDYLEVIRNRPKLAMYGSTKLIGGDWIARPLMSLKLLTPTIRSLEHWYKCFGNVEIYHGNFSHSIISEDEADAATQTNNQVVNRAITEKIIRFLHGHM